MLEDPDWVQATVARNARRASFIERFTIAQRRRCPRRWFSFKEIADWCAREKGGSLRNEDRRRAAYRDLRSALLHGEFEKNGRPMVLCLAPERPCAEAREPERLDAEWARELMDLYKGDFAPLVLEHCWLPRELCRHWFAAQRIGPPGNWFAANNRCGTTDMLSAAQPESDPRWADPNISHEDWTAEVARRDAVLPPPRRVPSAPWVPLEPHEPLSDSSTQQKGWHQVKDYVGGRTAIQMIIHSVTGCTAPIALHHLLSALSDPFAGVRAVIPGREQLSHGGGWRTFRVDEARSAFVGPGGMPVYRVAEVQITNLALRAYIGRNLWPGARDNAVTAAAGPVQHPPRVERPQTSRGRRGKYNWAPVLDALRAKLQEDGCPASGDGGQANLERWTAEQFPPDACPGESVIREKVKNEIEAFRKELGIEAGI